MKYRINVLDCGDLMFSIETNDHQLKTLEHTQIIFKEIRHRFKKYQHFTCEVEQIDGDCATKLDTESWNK